MAATFKNFATTKLTQNLSASATTAYVSSADAAKLPIADGVDSWFYLVIQRATESSYFEVVKVTNKVDGTLTIVREQEGTIAKAFLLNDLAEARLTTMSLLDAFVGKSDWRLWAVTEAQFESERAINRRRFAASGYESFGKQIIGGDVHFAINEGLFTRIADPSQNSLYSGRITESATGKSKSKFAVVNVAGVMFDLVGIGETFSGTMGAQIKFPQAPDGKTTYNKATGVNTVHASASAAFAAQAADPTNVEVVINRVDMWGKEVWAEEVSTTNPYIYPNGLPQSIATTMDGITTSSSNRPVSYYAFFSGDSLSKGKGLNFFSLTDAQKKKVLANPKNNIVLLNDGRLIQWRLRVRTFVGLGNGDWNRIENTSVDALDFQGAFYTTAQGNRDIPATVINNDNIYLTTSHPDGAMSIGCFSTAVSSPLSDNDACYFLVCGTVNRLNQGAYHPSFNPSGADLIGDNASNTTAGRLWHESRALIITSVSDAFSKAGSLSGSRWGAIGSTLSGRPDGRFYDAIYAEGQGGVCRDMRYSAYGKTLEDFAEADQRVKNGTYRGFEKLIRTKVIHLVVTGVGDYEGGHYIRSNGVDFSLLADKQYSLFYNKTKNIIGYIPIVERGNLYLSTNPICKGLPNTADAASGMRVDPYTGTQVGDEVYLIAGLPMTASVGGSFLQTDVIGNPANILATPALANGWQGSWIPVIPDGTTKPYPYARKKVGENLGRGWAIWTTDGGAHWSMGSYTNSTSETLNIFTNSPLASIFVALVPYQAFAKQTESAVVAPVYGGTSGVGYVFASSFPLKETWVALAESLFGGILKSDSHTGFMFMPLISFSFDVEALHPYSPYYTPKHSVVSLAPPTNNSPAFKALSYNVNINQQAVIQYAYTELKHNGTNLGDDGNIMIVDNQSTKPDTNNTTVLVGTARLKEPLGWIKNNV